MLDSSLFFLLMCFYWTGLKKMFISYVPGIFRLRVQTFFFCSFWYFLTILTKVPHSAVRVSSAFTNGRKKASWGRGGEQTDVSDKRAGLYRWSMCAAVWSELQGTIDLKTNTKNNRDCFQLWVKNPSTTQANVEPRDGGYESVTESLWAVILVVRRTWRITEQSWSQPENLLSTKTHSSINKRPPGRS